MHYFLILFCLLAQIFPAENYKNCVLILHGIFFNFRCLLRFSTSALQILHGLDLSTRTALVTGSNTGIGFEIARSLALHGCTVILACRDMPKAEAAAGRIRKERANVKVWPMMLNLSCLSSVRQFACQFLNQYSSLDMLILNAGVFGVDYCLTDDGLETMFQVSGVSD